MSAPARMLEWDSQFFGRRVARAELGRLAPESLAALRAWCRAESVEWLYFLADADDDVTVGLAEQAGFHLVDVRIELDVALVGQRRAAPIEGVVVRPATDDDLAALTPIAAAGHVDSRYFFDPHVPADRARALYESWIERSVRKQFADVVLVGDVDGEAAGYITGRLGPDSTASIGLIGVGPAARGRGMGTALVHELLSWAASAGAERVTVVTQGRNVQAQRLYQRCGFLTRSVHLWYHFWPAA